MKNRSGVIISVLLCTAALMTACGSSGSVSMPSYDTAEAGSFAAAESSMEDSYGSAKLSGDVYDDYEYEETAAEEAETDNVDIEDPGVSDRKLIRTVYLDVETYDFDELTAEVASKVKSLGGYIENSSVDGSTSSSSRYADYTLRIPKANADSFITAVSDEGNVTHRSENMEDVTLQYVDSKSRKESLQTEYKRLEELLLQAEDVEELIYIESRMSEVRYQIESIESQLRTYDNQVDYTTIHLSISEVKEYTEPDPVDDSVGARIKRGYSRAYDNITTFMSDLIVFIAVAIPYLILLAIIVLIVVLIVLFIRFLVRKSQNNPERLKKKAEKAAKLQAARKEAYERKYGYAVNNQSAPSSYTDDTKRENNTGDNANE